MPILEFIITCFLGVILSIALAVSRPVKDKSLNIEVYIWMMLSAVLLVSLVSHLGSLDNALLVSGILFVGIGIFSGVLLIKSPVLQAQSVILLWLVVVIGICIGLGHLLLSILITLIILCIFLALEGFRWTIQPYIKEGYLIAIEISNMKSLDAVDSVMRKLKLELIKKEIVKTDRIHLELTYFSTAATHKVFLRKLCSLKGVGEIIRITL